MGRLTMWSRAYAPARRFRLILMTTIFQRNLRREATRIGLLLLAPIFLVVIGKSFYRYLNGFTVSPSTRCSLKWQFRTPYWLSIRTLAILTLTTGILLKTAAPRLRFKLLWAMM